MASLSGSVLSMPMATTPPEMQRPTMRRKSSAQNLLSSFKASPNPSPNPTSGGNVPLSSGVPSFAAAGMPAYSTATATPVATMFNPGSYMTARDVDSQSLHSESPLVNGASPALPAGTSVEYLRDLVQKRIITLTYMRNVHEGRSHWFHTIMMSRGELDKVFNNVAMKKRTKRFAILGMSLSNLLDIHQPQDLLRGLLNTLTEYDQSKEDSDKPKMRLFKSKMKRQAAGGSFADYSVTSTDGPDATCLVTPHMPFPLDYHQTLLSLLDVLSEVYAKLGRILGPSPFPHSSQHMMGPLGLLAPHPGVSYLFSGAEALPKDDVKDEGSLWGIAHAHAPQNAMGAGVGGAGYTNTGGLSSPPPSWTPALAEMVLKVDGKFKKITSVLLKELDAFARNGIKDELASLDPLLRNVAIADDGREQFDFEGYV